MPRDVVNVLTSIPHVLNLTASQGAALLFQAEHQS